MIRADTVLALASLFSHAEWFAMRHLGMSAEVYQHHTFRVAVLLASISGCGTVELHHAYQLMKLISAHSPSRPHKLVAGDGFEPPTFRL